MSALIAILLWFGSGAIGAWVAARHYRRLFPGARASDLEVPNTISVIMGPIGLMGALFHIAAFSDG